MISVRDLNPLIGDIVSEVILKVWPPYLEPSSYDVDSSIILRFVDYGYVLISVGDDGFIMDLKRISFANPLYSWEVHSNRVKSWLEGELEEIAGFEYYDFSEHPSFNGIINCALNGFDLYFMDDDQFPFAVKLKFEFNEIFVSPNADGTCIETKLFKENSRFQEVFKQENILIKSFGINAVE